MSSSSDPGRQRYRILAAVRAHPKPPVQTLARTLALTGCRVSEALGIRACDVDLESAEAPDRDAEAP